MRYHTFDLTITATGTPYEYLLAAQSPQGEPSGRTKIAFDAAPLADWLKQLAEQTLSPQDLQALGTALYECLFVGEINLVFQRALGETLGRDDLGLRLRLRLNPPELAALPWEYLYSPERRLFLAASVETPLSRYLNLPEPVRRLAVPEKINLLVVMTQNSGLDTTAERQALEKVATQLRDRLTVDFLEGEATSAAIRTALRQKDYHILHYAGHGAFNVAQASKPAYASIADKRFALQLSSRMTDEAFLYLDHEEKLTEPITAEQFAHFFTDYAFTRLVFLNACQGATRSSHQALAGVAPQLVLRGVPAVVAMQEKIDNDDAILFATEFYAELCRERDGGQVEVAISRARKALLQEKPNSAVFGNPVLYLRAEDGLLWEAQTTSPPSEPHKKKSLLERWQVWTGIIIATLTVLTTLLELPEKIGKFVASFSKPDTTRSAAQPVWQKLEGKIIDENHNPLPEVIVHLTLPGKTLADTTDFTGRFEFDVLALPQARVSLKAMNEDYGTLDADPTLDGNLNTYQMRRVK